MEWCVCVSVSVRLCQYLHHSHSAIVRVLGCDPNLTLLPPRFSNRLHVTTIGVIFCLCAGHAQHVHYAPRDHQDVALRRYDVSRLCRHIRKGTDWPCTRTHVPRHIPHTTQGTKDVEYIRLGTSGGVGVGPGTVVVCGVMFVGGQL